MIKPINKKRLLCAAAGALAVAGLAAAQSDTNTPAGSAMPNLSGNVAAPGVRGSTPQSMAIQTTLTGRLVNLHEFMTGQPLPSLATTATPTAPGYANRGGVPPTAAGNTAAQSSAGVLAGTNSTDKVVTGSATLNGSDPSVADTARGSAAAPLDQTMALIDDAGNLVILGESWGHGESRAAEAHNIRAADTTAKAVADVRASEGTSNPGLTGSPDALPNSVPPPAAANAIGGNPTVPPSTGTIGATVPPTPRPGATLAPGGWLTQGRLYVNQRVSVSGMQYSRAGLRYLDVHSLVPTSPVVNSAAVPPSENLR